MPPGRGIIEFFWSQNQHPGNATLRLHAQRNPAKSLLEVLLQVLFCQSGGARITRSHLL